MTSICHIHILGDDILLYIFELLTESTRVSFRYINIISHVCSRWRALSTSCPELWRRFALLTQLDRFSRGYEYTNTMLSRCRDVGLEAGWERFHPYLPSRMSDPTTPSVIAELELGPRLRSYYLDIPYNPDRVYDPSHTVFLSALQRCSAPNMDALNMQFRWPTNSVKILPPTIFGGDLPALKSIHMKKCWVDIRQMKLPKLTSLTARFYNHELPVEPLYPSQFHSWLEVLKEFPNLTHLRIDLQVPARPFPEGIHPVHVSLNHLTELRMLLHFADFEMFLDHVRIPACRKIKFKIMVTEYDDFKDRLEQTVARYVIPSPDGNRLSVLRYEGLVFEIGCSPCKDYHPENPYKNTNDIIIRFQMMYHSHTALVGAFHRYMEGWLPVVDHITSLYIPRPTTKVVSQQPICEFIQHAHALETLICTESAMAEIMGGSVTSVGDGQFVYDLRPSLKIMDEQKVSCYVPVHWFES